MDLSLGCWLVCGSGRNVGLCGGSSSFRGLGCDVGCG